MDTKTNKILIEVLNKLKDPNYDLEESKIDSYLKELNSHLKLQLELEKLTKYPRSVKDTVFYVFTNLDLDFDTMKIQEDWIHIKSQNYVVDFDQGLLVIYLCKEVVEFKFPYREKYRGLIVARENPVKIYSGYDIIDLVKLSSSTHV